MTSNPRTAANPGQMGAQTTTGRCIVQRASTRNLQGPQAAVAYIEAHLGEPLTLDVIAQASHYSKYHLHRCFVESLGITASAYIWRRRLTEAARQLALTDRRIVDIAIEFGFGSQQAFTRAFKIGYKQPPCRFRRGSALYPLQLPALLADEFASQPPADRTTRLRFASPDDVPSWMELVGQTVDGYPHLDEQAYLEAPKAPSLAARRCCSIATDASARRSHSAAMRVPSTSSACVRSYATSRWPARCSEPQPTSLDRARPP